MRYRIGEVAELFGITKEGVRYYERKGIIHAQREAETGYRYYSRDEITRLKQIRLFEGLGFSLEESKAIVVETGYDEVSAMIDVKLEQLRKKAEAIAAASQVLERQRAAIERFEQGAIEVRMTPDVYFLRRAPDEASGRTPEERQVIAKTRSDEKEWVKAMPPVWLMGMHYDRNFAPVYDVLGSAIDVDTARRLGLPTERAVVLAGRLCLCSTVRAPLGQKPEIGHLSRWMDENGVRLCGDIYGALQSVYRAEDGSRWGIHDFYLPIEEKL